MVWCYDVRMSMYTREINRQYVIRSLLTVELLLLIPLIGMWVSDDWNWSLLDFILAAIFLAVTRAGALLFAFGIRTSKLRLAVAGVAVVLFMLLAWIELAVGLFGSPVAGN